MDAGLAKILFAVANEARFLVSKRIHNEGKAADGTPFGEYSATSKRIRKKLGRQTDYIDYQITGRLLKLYITGINAAGNICIGYREPYLVPDDDKRVESIQKKAKKKSISLIQAVKSSKQSGTKHSLVEIIETKWKEHGGAHKMSDSELRHTQESATKLLAQWSNRFFKK